jgi:AraC family transcriptional regulator
MSKAIRLYKGPFGRASLLDMDSRLVTHAHHHCHVLIKASGPDATFVVRDHVCSVTQNKVLLLNSWEPHAYLHQSAGDKVENTVILSLHIEPKWLSGAERKLVHVSHPKFFSQPEVEISSRTRDLADNVVMELWWGDQLSEQRLESILFELIIQIIGALPNERRRLDKPSDFYMPVLDARIKKAIALMSANKDVDIGMEKLAKDCCLSRAHFFTLFREQTGVTPNVYANTLRMEEAFDRLSDGQDSISELAFHLGFSAPGHFTRFFSQHQGITPREFRRALQHAG